MTEPKYVQLPTREKRQEAYDANALKRFLRVGLQTHVAEELQFIIQTATQPPTLSPV